MFAFLNNRRQGTRSRARPQPPGPKKNNIAMNAMLKLRKFEIDSRVEKNFATNYGKQREMLELLRDLGNEMFEFGHKKAVLKNCIQLGLPLLLVDLICALTTKHIKSGTIARGGAVGPCFGVGITHLLNELCSVLRELLYDFPSLCNPSMVGSVDFITHIMHYLLGVNNVDTACVLLEEIVAYREKTLRLSDIPDFEKIIMSVSSRQLALFMRIFAILIFEPEKKGDEKDPHHHGGHGESSAGESTAGETKTKDESSAAAATSTASGATISTVSTVSTGATSATTSATSATTSSLASPSSPSSSSLSSSISTTVVSSNHAKVVSSSPSSSSTIVPDSVATTSTRVEPLKKTMSLLCPPNFSRRRIVHTIDQNHAFLLKIPGLIARMCRLLERVIRKAERAVRGGAGGGKGGGEGEGGGEGGASSAAQQQQRASTTPTETAQQRSMNQISEALRTMLRGGEEGNTNSTMNELAYMLGLPPAALQQLASLNTGDMEIDSFMGSLLGGPSSMLNSDDDEEDEDEIVPNEPIDSFVTESSSRRRSTTTATATTTTTTSNPHEEEEEKDPDEPLPPPLHFMSPDHHTALANAVKGMPILPQHCEGLDYDQMSILQHLVEVLFVIAILCGGKRKIDVQNQLASFGLTDTLSKLFDMMDWTPGHRQGHGPHGPGCQCNPKSAPKIQFLRLVHNFCDRDASDVRHRASMLKSEDHIFLNRIANILSTNKYFAGLSVAASAPRIPMSSSAANTPVLAAPVPATATAPVPAATALLAAPAAGRKRGKVSPSTIGHLMNQLHEIFLIEQDRKKKISKMFPPAKEGEIQDPNILKSGLLDKILVVLGQAPGDSPIKFWLATSVESFLRGGGPEIQIYVALANYGTFLKTIVSEIVQGEGAGSGGLQTNFDLLGELIKFNPVVLRLLNQVLEHEQKFDEFMQVVRLHLVDSNVLLRSILLTIEFEQLRCADDNEILSSSTRFHEYLSSQNLPTLLSDMCTIVGPGDVTQENLCCLNSSLVLLVFAHRRKQVPMYVQRLKDLENERGTPGSIRKNFRQLLWFWNEYYHNRAADRKSLENSSRIEFSELADVVHVLTSCEKVDTEHSLLGLESSMGMVEFQKWRVDCKRMIQEAVIRQRKN